MRQNRLDFGFEKLIKNLNVIYSEVPLKAFDKNKLILNLILTN
jgi:hypothetical protein